MARKNRERSHNLDRGEFDETAPDEEDRLTTAVRVHESEKAAEMYRRARELNV